ncbi:MAG: polysaccharide biosynthesis C-terminal domain-containing protein, partial [Bacteroidales bacterium]|nr:polysaccharide biosynthesis C-terminal domain-containing protein [Bacteroidales bacterium]
LIAVCCFRWPIANAIGEGIEQHPEYVLWIAWILAFDTMSAIPFAKLRIEERPLKFAAIKLSNILIVIVLNVFFLSICPKLVAANSQGLISHIYSEETGVGYVLVANMLASAASFLLLTPQFRFKLRFDRKLLRTILNYSFPILVVGIFGMIVQDMDKILLPKLSPADDPMSETGLYGVAYKLAVLLNVFAMAFRYSYEPYFFKQKGTKEDAQINALIMKYFITFGLLIFLTISLFLELLIELHIIPAGYSGAFPIVPVILMGNLFMGVFYTLSRWYKKSDRTWWGAGFAIVGAIISQTLNVLLIPIYGLTAAAWSFLVSWLCMMLLSWSFERKYYRMRYPLRRIGGYFVLAMGVFFVSRFASPDVIWLRLTFNAALLALFISIIWFFERKELLKV